MWVLLVVLALIIIAAQALLWRLQRSLLMNVRDSQRRMQSLEAVVWRLSSARSGVQERNGAQDMGADHGLMAEATAEDEENRYQRARLLAESGRNAHYIAAACQVGEEEAELLIRLLRK